jgi:hypothetical protein
MTIKVDDTEIPVPEFITSELSKKRNRKLFDIFIRNVLTAQGQRIRKTLKNRYDNDKNWQDIFEKMIKGMRI